MIIHSSFLVFLLGALFAVILGATFDLYKFVFGYTIVFTAVLSVSYSNNYFDVAIDKYSTQTLFSGGSYILVGHPELLKLTKWIAIGLLGLSILLGFMFIAVFSYPITFLVLVIFGNLLGWFYSAPPIKLIYRGIGEISTTIAAGFLIPGFGYFVIMGRINSSFIVLSIPLLIYGFVLSLNFESPDIDSDHRGNKKTLVVRKGLYFGFVISTLLLVFATLSFSVIAQFTLIDGVVNFWLIAFLSLIPLSFSIQSPVKYKTGKKVIRKVVTINSSTIFFCSY